jgi:hypothetical protein
MLSIKEKRSIALNKQPILIKKFNPGEGNAPCEPIFGH